MKARHRLSFAVFSLAMSVVVVAYAVGCSTEQEAREGSAAVPVAAEADGNAKPASGDRDAADAMIGCVVTEQQIAQQVGEGYELEFGESGSCELNRGISKGTFHYDGFQIDVQSKDGWEHLEVLKVYD